MGSGKEMGKTIGEVERITEIPKREIKYCIEQRLICPGKKSESGYWLYDEQEIRKLQMVVLLRRLEYRQSYPNMNTDLYAAFYEK